MKYRIFLPALMLSMGLAGCMTGETQGNSTLVLDDSLVVNGHACTFNVNLALADGDDIAATAINGTLARHYFNVNATTPQQALQMWHDSLANEYTEFITNTEAVSSPSMEWAYELQSEEIETKQGLRCFRETYYTYLGGAHGSHGTFYYHFDAATGTALDMQDLLGLTPEEALPLIQAELARQNGFDVSDLEDNGYWAAEHWEPTQQFYLHGDSVTFLFNIYEAACYAAGEIEIDMPRQRLMP